MVTNNDIEFLTTERAQAFDEFREALAGAPEDVQYAFNRLMRISGALDKAKSQAGLNNIEQPTEKIVKSK